MDTIEQIKEVMNPVFKKHQVSVAYLFGSVARGKSGPRSDIDIAVQFKQAERDTEKRIYRDSALSSDLEVVVKRTVDLIDLGEITNPLLRHRAIRRGRLVYCTDDALRHILELKALHDYEDTRYLRDSQDKAMMNRIKVGTYGKSL